MSILFYMIFINMIIESIIKKVLNEEFGLKRNINENISINDTLKSFDEIKIEDPSRGLGILTVRMKDSYFKNGKIDEKSFLAVKSKVEMIYSSIKGEAEPGIYQKLLDDANGKDLPDLVENLTVIVGKLRMSIRQFYVEVNDRRNFKNVEKKLFDDVNPLSKTVMLYLDMIKDKNSESELDSDVTVSESIYGYKYLYEDIYGSVEKVNFLNEAEYQGRNVQLGKIMQGDIKKSKVYVKNDKGTVVKVNFGFGGKSAKGKIMRIKKNNPERRKSFRARHNCDNPGPRWKPRYWACRTW